MSTAFQSSGFQNNGVQVEVISDVIRESTYSGGGGFGSYSSIYFDNLKIEKFYDNEEEIEELLLVLFNLGVI